MHKAWFVIVNQTEHLNVFLPFNLCTFLWHLTLQLNPLIHCGLHWLNTFNYLYWQLYKTKGKGTEQGQATIHGHKQEMKWDC